MDYIKIKKSELEELFIKATNFVTWTEYEEGYDLRDRATKVGLDYFLKENKIKAIELEKNEFLCTRESLESILRKVIDESKYLYYEVNGVTKNKHPTQKEKKAVAKYVLKDFITQ